MVEYAVLSSAYGYLIKPLVAREVLTTVRLALERRCFNPSITEPIVLRGEYRLYLDGAHSIVVQKSLPSQQKCVRC